jgi:Domain of unknown function (DUF4258)
MPRKRPAKAYGIVAKVAADLASGKVILSEHALKQMRARNISRRDALWILRSGWREPIKDEWKEEYNAWTYAYRGLDEDRERRLRIAVALKTDGTLIVTTIDLDREDE